MKRLSHLTFALTAVVMALHAGFFILEMFYWDHPIGRQIFGMTPEVSAASAPLAMQQALYNGFLVAGLIWGMFTRRSEILVFFLSCVIVAGTFAAMTVKPSIFVTQALPGLIALLSLIRR